MLLPEGVLELLLTADMEKDEQANLVYGNMRVREYDEALNPPNFGNKVLIR
jgi:hypothetical protein